MISHTGRRFIRRLPYFLLPVLFLAIQAVASDLSPVTVKRVLDGDTLVLSSSDRVRLLGLDAPEKGEPFSGKARDRLGELTRGGEVTIESCSERDQYGRVLAVVRNGAINVNMLLLEEGLAIPMLIPPCGKMVVSEVLTAAEKAIEAGKGIYALDDYRVVNHEEAGNYIGRNVIVHGKVVSLHKGEKAWHLNFGIDWKSDFTAVLFRRGLSRYKALGLDPEALVGREIMVMGHVKSYNGPEIIVKGPEQIIPVP